MIQLRAPITITLLLAAISAACGTKRVSIADAMKEYCKAADANLRWCDASADVPASQKWEILDGYCADVPGVPRRRSVTNPAGPVCEMYRDVEHPFALVYDMRRKSWSANAAFTARTRQGAVDLDDPTGKPSVFLSKGEELGIIVEQVNPVAYRAERGETTVRDIEGLQNIQAVLTAAGGALGSIASITALARSAASDAEPLDAQKEAAAREEAVDALQTAEKLVPQAAFDRAVEGAAEELERRDYAAAGAAITEVREKLRAFVFSPAMREKVVTNLDAALEATVEAEKAAADAARDQPLRQSIATALKEDLVLVEAAGARVKGPLARVRSHVDRLDAQLRRVQTVGRGLNETSQRIGREFDADIERPATWSDLYETLRRARRDAPGGIAACKTMLDKYQAVVGANADKPVEVQVAAVDFDKELAVDATPVRHSCSLPNLRPLLTANVAEIAAAASRLSLRPSSEWVANSGPLREAQARGRDALAVPAGILVRQTAAFASVLEDVDKVLAKEVDIKKQAAVSKMLTDRVRDASLKQVGGLPQGTTSYACAPSPLAAASAMSLRVLKATDPDESVMVTITLFDENGARLDPRTETVASSASVGDDIPLGIADVDYFRGCSALEVRVNGAATPGPNPFVEVVVHPGYVVANRLFVHERSFEGSLTKVQTDRFAVSLSQPRDLEIVVDGPSKVESSYDLSRRHGPIFGANVGVIYTPAYSRTFTLVDPTPLETVATTRTEESGATKQVTTVLERKTVQEQTRETRAGQFAAFLNIRALQALVPQTSSWWIKPGVEVGFGIDKTKPSILLGGSFEIARYFRLGAGKAWVSTTDAKDPSIIGREVDPAFVVPTETRFRETWYASFTFALDALSMFSKN